MEKIMNDNDSKAFLKDMARLYPKYKDNFGAVSNLIVLLMEELQKERKGRKQGEKYKKMWGKLKGGYWRKTLDIYNTMERLEQKHFPKEAKQDYPESEE